MLADSTAAASVKICLLDDDPCVLKGTGRLLRSAGWEIEAFSDPHSFLHYVQQHQPRLVVIDMWMPLMHGLEVQKNLRQLSSTTKVIVVTATSDPFVRAEAMKAGASAFCLKPIDGEFLAAVETALER
jgi:FixJ family two-component response regulator